MGDEPDGSGKFIANVIRSPKVKEAIEYMLKENDGLILGICNGFQALIKTGLLPDGEIKELGEDDPTLTFNTVGRHIACLVDTKVLTTNSPWLSTLEENKSYKVPISHGEGRLVGSEECVRSLFENEQVVAMYEDCPNGSVLNIESLISKDGKILGKMGHSERVDSDLYKNIEGIEYQNIFRAGVEYFKEK
ncbi:phosphoribosylformylglycinamidine synthase II [Peptoniphilus indolicus ATCC 29427]|uniref:Phosphoribosylformylglycinamidine synthase II n=2 Tax=Peptoniphilus indolicus TaxID=33030 RepID=G4D407_9FIRM|nr:phosphoribosylformylglycinamidine synthase II [Peptoniphilus indolicus ATCC 29427]